MAKPAVPGQGHQCHQSLAANCPGRNSPSHRSRLFHFYRHNSAVSTKREMGASRLEAHPQCWMGLPEQPDSGMLQWRQCHTCVTDHLLLSAHKQPAGTGRSVNLRQGPCLPSELASRSAVKPQEQRYCLIVLINIVTRCSPDPPVGRENPREATSFTTRSLKPALQRLPSPPRCPPG